MALVNKNIASAFGYAVFGRAVLNLDFDSQNIPSELYDKFRAVCGLARPSGKIEKRYPWIVRQPGTSKQVEVWDIFLKSTRCFALQPEAGGVEPPVIGPRNRSWWYDNDPGIDPIYYNYFMKETLNYYFVGKIPPWGGAAITKDTFVSAITPDETFDVQPETQAHIGAFIPQTTIHRAYMKTPGVYSKKLAVYHTVEEHTVSPLRIINVHSVDPEAFDVTTLTWNSQPALGGVIATFTPVEEGSGWLTIDIGVAEAVCFRFADESRPAEGELITVFFRAYEFPNAVFRPYHELEI